MKAAIVIPVIAQLVEERRPMVKAVRDAEALQAAYEQKTSESREEARARRLQLGIALLADRQKLPRRGTKENGWRAYLEAIEVDEATAWRYMREAAQATGATFQEPDLKHNEPDLSPSPAPRDDDAPPEPAVARDEDGARDPAAESAPKVDRNTWCTPEWLATALGPWDLDPCSNERSHIQAAREFRWERSEDGLFLASSVDAKARVFINPPYARGQVIRWVQAYAHTRFCFLLKFDPSTEWFAELLEHAQLILIPRGTRIDFEPPPGVPEEDAQAVQFPHALFFARPEDAVASLRDICLPPWRLR